MRGVADVELRQADVLRLEGLPDAWTDYDLIVSASMLEYVPRDALPVALEGLRRRLAKDGVLLWLVLSGRIWGLRSSRTASD